MLERPFEEAVAPYRQEGTVHLDTSKLKESQINAIGYQLMEFHKEKAAQQLFKMNIAAFPESSNTYDSYAEACLRMGKTMAAAEYYQKAYEMDNSNETAKAIANRLRRIPLERSSDDKERISFLLNSYPNARHVALAGSFNNWNQLTIPMHWENGQWKTEVSLEPGTYKYKFVVDGIWIPDPQNKKVDAEDYFNSILEVQ